MSLYEKVISVFSALRSAIGRKMAREDVAKQYDPSLSYNPGDLVVYNNVLYMCTSYHSLAEWSNDDFTPATVDQALRYAVSLKVGQAMDTNLVATKDDLANEFDSSTPYAVDDLVLHDGVLYRCTSAHQGAWGDGSDFTPSTVNAAISGSVGGMAISLNESLRGDLAPKADVAPNFSPESSYVPGQRVYYNGTLYRCVVAHAGAWGDGTHFSSGSASIGAALDLKANKGELGIDQDPAHDDRKIVRLKQGTEHAFLTSHQSLADYATEASVTAELTRKLSCRDAGFVLDYPYRWNILGGSGGMEELPFSAEVTFDNDAERFYVWGGGGSLVAGPIAPGLDNEQFEFEWNNKTWQASKVPCEVLLDGAVNQLERARYYSVPWLVPPRKPRTARHFFVHLDLSMAEEAEFSSLDIRLQDDGDSFYGVHGDSLCIEPASEMLLEFMEIAPGCILVKNCLVAYEIPDNPIRIGECGTASSS